MKLGKKILFIALSMVLCLGVAVSFTGCSKKTVLKVFAHEGAYGKAFWSQIEADFEKMYDNKVDVQVTPLPTIDETLTSALGAKVTYPDVVYFGTNQKNGYVNTNIIKTAADTLLMDLTDVLDANIPGENVKLKEKIDPDFLGTSATSPFAGDTKTYMLPLFYTVNGVFYNKALLGAQAVPKTYAQLAAITPTEPTAKVFGYPRGGYLDNMHVAAAKSTMTATDYAAWMKLGYTETMYDDSYKGFFTALDALKPGFMNDFQIIQTDNGDVKANTKQFYDSKVTFFVGGSMMPSDAKTWQVASAENVDKFNSEKVGFMPFPTVTESQNQHFVSMIEQVYPLKTGNAEKEKLAKEFSAYLFSDAATKVIATKNAMVPTTNRNAIATEAKMDAFTQGLFGVNGDPIFASMPNSTIPTGKAGSAELWNLAFKQVNCFGINKVMGAKIVGDDSKTNVAPDTGLGLFEELKLWSQIYNA